MRWAPTSQPSLLQPRTSFLLTTDILYLVTTASILPHLCGELQHLLYNGGSQPGMNSPHPLPPGDIWQCLEGCLVVTAMEVLLASRRQWPGMPLNTLLCTEPPPCPSASSWSSFSVSSLSSSTLPPGSRHLRLQSLSPQGGDRCPLLGFLLRALRTRKYP